MYSHTASMLYFSCAEMGTTGAASATVPCTNAFIASCWLAAALSLRRPAPRTQAGSAVPGAHAQGFC